MVVLGLRGDALPNDTLAAELGRELGHPVVLSGEQAGLPLLGMLTVTYRRAAGEVAVSWDSGARTVTRVIAAAPEPAQLTSDIVLLAGNLAREPVEPSPGLAASPLVHEPQPADAAAPPEHFLATVGLLYPLSSNYGKPEVSSNFDLNLLHGRVGAIVGAQLGVVNVVARSEEEASLEGLQAGLLLNFVGGNVAGVQFGAINFAHDVQGFQLGLINVAHELHGVSIGLLNIADDVDGVPLAPISVTRTGGVHPIAWAGSSGLGNLGVKFATRSTYTIFNGSYHEAFDLQFVGGGFAIGGRIELGAGLHADLDASATYLAAPHLTTDAETQRTYHEQLFQPRLRLSVGYRLAQHFGPFLGIAAVGQIRSELDWDRVSGSVGPEIFGGLEL